METTNDKTSVQETRARQRKDFLAWLESAKVERIRELKAEEQEVRRERIQMPQFEDAKPVNVELQAVFDEKVFEGIAEIGRDTSILFVEDVPPTQICIDVDVPKVVVSNQKPDYRINVDKSKFNVPIVSDEVQSNPSLEVGIDHEKFESIRMVDNISVTEKVEVPMLKPNCDVLGIERNNIALPEETELPAFGVAIKEPTVVKLTKECVPERVQWKWDKRDFEVPYGYLGDDIKLPDERNGFLSVEVTQPKLCNGIDAINVPDGVQFAVPTVKGQRVPNVNREYVRPDCSDILEMLYAELSK